jgi:glycosyltransferase involved in cell wall biosynthesis
MNFTKKLTVLTTTKNSQNDIVMLINCLNEQVDKNFNWLVIDGGSTDDTVSLIEQNCLVSYKVVSSDDFSIYHAMNIGVSNVDTQYYCVAGADDLFELDFVLNINSYLIHGTYDLIFGSVKIGKKIIFPATRMGWLKGMHGIGSSHSVGSVINKDLHQNFGFYSKMYPIVADQVFIKKSIYGGAKVLRLNKLFGTYSIHGFSSNNKLHYQFDFFKMQLETEKFWILQLIFFILRFIKLNIMELLKRGH